MNSSSSKPKAKRPLSAPHSSPERNRKRKPKSKSASKGKTTRDKSVTITLPPKNLSKSKSVSISRPPKPKGKDEKASQLKKAVPLLPPENNKQQQQQQQSKKLAEPAVNKAKPIPQVAKKEAGGGEAKAPPKPKMSASKILPLLMIKAGNAAATTNPMLDPKKLPVLKAAAKLSLRWPGKSGADNDDDDSIDLASALMQQQQQQGKKGNPVMLHEIRNFLEAAKTPALKTNEWPFKKGNEWASALNEIVEGLQSKVSMHPVLPEKQPMAQNYMPIKTPHWNDVQTNWPGFEHKPLPNWMEYADPAKLSKSTTRSKSRSTKKKAGSLKGNNLTLPNVNHKHGGAPGNTHATTRHMK